MSYVHLRDAFVKTRKKHQCWGCLKIINIGEKAHYEVAISDGDFCCGYLHEFCREVLSNIFMDYLDSGDMVDQGFMNELPEFGFTLEQAKEWWGNDN